MLDFSDVLIVPTISDVDSRRLVNLTRKFKFKYSPYELECVPIMAANMDTVGTPQIMFDFWSKGCRFDSYRVHHPILSNG